MAPLDSNQDMDVQIATAVCEKHGEFEQKSFQIPMFKRRTLSRCPTCEAEQKAADEESARRQAELIRQIRLHEKLGSAAVPKRFEGKRFADYQCDTPEKTAALEKCMAYADNFKDNFQAGRNLILIGSPGTGKTHLGTSIANRLNHNTGHTAAYRTIGGVLQAIKETFNGDGRESEGSIIAGLTSVDLLVLDEIGATREMPSDFELSTIFAIINGRYEQQLPTVIISNLSAEALTQAMGDRCVDRLREGSPVVVQFKWESARRGIQ
jgi:DNA replication protein DnaC